MNTKNYIHIIQSLLFLFCECYRHIIATNQAAEKQLKDLWVYIRVSRSIRYKRLTWLKYWRNCKEIGIAYSFSFSYVACCLMLPCEIEQLQGSSLLICLKLGLISLSHCYVYVRMCYWIIFCFVAERRRRKTAVHTDRCVSNLFLSITLRILGLPYVSVTGRKAIAITCSLTQAAK